MSSEHKNSSRGFGGSNSPDVFGANQGTSGIGAPGASQFGQPAMQQFRGPTMINMFCQPGTYSVTTHFSGNVARTFGTKVDPNPNRHVHFSGDTRFSGPNNSSAKMPRESTPYPRGQSPNATMMPQEGSPKYFQP